MAFIDGSNCPEYLLKACPNKGVIKAVGRRGRINYTVSPKITPLETLNSPHNEQHTNTYQCLPMSQNTLLIFNVIVHISYDNFLDKFPR